jgi:uncharacterized membrane protein YhhN
MIGGYSCLLYLFAALYLVVVVLQLFACAGRNRLMLRRVTKCLLMPLLAVCYCLAARTVSPLVVAALISGFAGDVVLLFRPHRWAFPAGIFAFAAGHAFYIVAFLRAIPRLPQWYVFAPLGVLTLACALSLMRFLRKGIPARLKPPGFLYMLVIGSMASSALIFALSGVTAIGWVAALGGVFFVVSDTTLAVDAFYHPVRYRNVIVMSTYILAQTLLVSALASI